MSDLTSLSDATLDGAFDASYQVGDAASIAIYGAEIRARLQTVFSFLGGLLGQDRFPKYTARTGFQQSAAAQTSTSAAAVNVASNISSGATAVAGAAGNAIGAFLSPLTVYIAAGVVIGGGYFYFTRMKK